MNFQKLLDLDARWSKKLRVAESPGSLRTAAMLFAHSGNSWFWGVGILLVWFVGNPFWKSQAFMLGASVIITAVLVLAIKFSVKRRRPEGEWGGIYRHTDPHSFPSGHAACSFMLASMAVFLGPPWFAIILVIWAPLVGLARVAMGVHFVSDVIAGALLGIFMGWLNYNLIPIGLSFFQ